MNLGFLTTFKWQIISGAAAAALLTVSGLLVYSYIDNRHLTKVNHQLTDSIDNPATGYRVVIATERANRANMEAAVERQNGELVKQAAESQRRLTETTAALAIAQRATRQAEARVAVMLATPPRGNTVAERMADVDARVLEALK